MYQWVMNETGTVLPQHTFHSLNIDDINRVQEEWKHKDFEANIKLELGDSIYSPKDPIEEQETYVDENKGGEPNIPEASTSVTRDRKSVV